MKTILLWRFENAPEELRQLSTHGDEDWILFVPAGANETFDTLPFDRGTFGCCSISEHRRASFPKGIVYIGSHS